MKACPIEACFSQIGKKWSINIIRDLFMGKKRFKDFLNSNPELSTKMLSERLRELEKHDLIEKNIVSKSPIMIEYTLTKKGKSLNKILYELSIFSLQQMPEDVLNNTNMAKKAQEFAKKQFLEFK